MVVIWSWRSGELPVAVVAVVAVQLSLCLIARVTLNLRALTTIMLGGALYNHDSLYLNCTLFVL